MPTTIWQFDTTGDAYDACQCDERISDGDILWIPSENVIGIAGTWPVALTPNCGNLHSMDDPTDYLQSLDGVDLRQGPPTFSY